MQHLLLQIVFFLTSFALRLQESPFRKKDTNNNIMA